MKGAGRCMVVCVWVSVLLILVQCHPGHLDTIPQATQMVMGEIMAYRNYTHNSTYNHQESREFIAEVTRLASCTSNNQSCQCLTPDFVATFLGSSGNLTITTANIGRISVLVGYYLQNPVWACEMFAKNSTTYDFVEGFSLGSKREFVLNALATLEVLHNAIAAENPQPDETDTHSHDHSGGGHEHGDNCRDYHYVGTDMIKVTGNEIETLEYSALTVVKYALTGMETRRSCDHKDTPLPIVVVENVFAMLGDKSMTSHITLVDFIELMGKMSLGDSTHVADDHGHEHRRRKKRSLETNITKCYIPTEIMSIYGHGIEDETIIDAEAFTGMCPVLIQQQLSGVCNPATETVVNTITTAQKYGYSLLAVFIIACMALLGVAFLSCVQSDYFNYIMSFFVALGVGTMTGDSILHLIPAAFGLHSHSAGGSHGGPDGEFYVDPYVWYGLSVIAAIFAFFMLESLMDVMCGHSHSHAMPLGEKSQTNGHAGKANMAYEVSDSKDVSMDIVVPDDDDDDTACSAKPVAWMIIMGGALHNIANGMAIGAVFSTDLLGGLSTSIAVLFHEIPHELGDFAVLITNGMSIKQAALYNFLSSAIALVGVVVGVAVSTTESVRWIATVAAGLFIYIALADMIPELISLQKNKNRGLLFFIQIIGYIIGVGILTTISLIEQFIKF